MTAATVEFREVDTGVGQRLQVARVGASDGEPAAVVIRHGARSESTGLPSLFSGDGLVLPVEAARELRRMLAELLNEEDGP